MRLGRQACANRIPFDVVANPVELAVPCPVIVGLVLPKRRACAPEDRICLACSEALDRVHDFRQRPARRDENMNVVRHHYVGVQGVEQKIALREMECVHDSRRDIRAAKPGRPVRRAIEEAIHTDECLAGRKAIGRDKTTSWKGTVETPCDKYVFACRLPVRKATFVEDHISLVSLVGGTSRSITLNRLH